MDHKRESCQEKKEIGLSQESIFDWLRKEQSKLRSKIVLTNIAIN